MRVRNQATLGGSIAHADPASDAPVMLAVRVPPGAFTPPPKVDSAVVRMVPLPAQRLVARDEERFAAVVAAAFSQRRKTLRNAARALVGESAYAETGIDPGRRGETLSVREFVALSDSKA